MIALGVVRPTGDSTATYELVYASNTEWIDWSELQEAMETV
jgi:predicted ATPase